MQIIKLNPSDQKQCQAALEQAAACLATGGLLIYPTETVYGIGADPSNSAAVDKLLRYKGRREGKPMSIAVSDQNMAEQYVEINEQALKFYQNFLPGPYTVVSRSKKMVDSRVDSEFGTLGIRIPAYSLITDLAKKFGRAFTSTSANASGKKRPYTIADILDNLSDKQKTLIDLIIDVGQLPANEPSVVVDTTLSAPLALRGSLAQAGGTTLTSSSENETIELAGRLMLANQSELKKNGLIFALNGQLGMGKTIFAKGVAKFLGITETISSPTYSYINEYPYTRLLSSGTFYHIDAWKIDSQEEVNFLRIAELTKANNVIVIEWFEQIAPWLELPGNLKVVTLNFAQKENLRQITIHEKSHAAS